jgi:DDE_Tnp_1-associated
MEGITIRDHFTLLEDRRVERTKQHQLLDIITIALCAVICGADTWVDGDRVGPGQTTMAGDVSGVAQRHPLP